MTRTQPFSFSCPRHWWVSVISMPPDNAGDWVLQSDRYWRVVDWVLKPGTDTLLTLAVINLNWIQIQFATNSATCDMIYSVSRLGLRRVDEMVHTCWRTNTGVRLLNIQPTTVLPMVPPLFPRWLFVYVWRINSGEFDDMFRISYEVIVSPAFWPCRYKPP